MATNRPAFDLNERNRGAVWSAMAAYDLEADPRYAELERKLGVTAAKTIAITSAGHFWNADQAFSQDRLRSDNVPLDEYRANTVRLGIFQAVEGVARGVGLKDDAIARISDGFYARLSSFERATLGSAGPVSVVGQAELTAAIAREAGAARAPASEAGTLDGARGGVGTLAAFSRFADMPTGARYDQLSGGAATSGTAYYGTPAGMAEMRQLAVAQGVPWVAGNPDLLRLGPEVIKAIAQTGMLQTNYRHLVESGFKPAEVGSIARGVRELGLSKEDNRKLYEVIAEAFKGANTTEDQERRRQVSALFGEMGDHPERKREIAGQISRVLDDIVKAHPDAAHIKAVEQGKALLEKAADVNQKAADVNQKAADVNQKAADVKIQSVDVKQQAGASTEVKKEVAAAVGTKQESADDLFAAALDTSAEKPAEKQQAAVKPAPAIDPQKVAEVDPKSKPAENDPKAKPKQEASAATKKPTLNPTA